MLTQAEVERRIAELDSLLADALQTYAGQVVFAARARHAYKLEQAKALLKVRADPTRFGLPEKPAVALVEAEAFRQVEALALEAHVAEAHAEAGKEIERGYQAQLSALQSLLRAVKDQT